MKHVIVILVISIPMIFMASGLLYSGTMSDHGNNRFGSDRSSILPISSVNSSKARVDALIKKLDHNLSDEISVKAEEEVELPVAGRGQKKAVQADESKSQKAQSQPQKPSIIENINPREPDVKSGRDTDKIKDTAAQDEESAAAAENTDNPVIGTVKEKIIEDVINPSGPETGLAVAEGTAHDTYDTSNASGAEASENATASAPNDTNNGIEETNNNNAALDNKSETPEARTGLIFSEQ